MSAYDLPDKRGHFGAKAPRDGRLVHNHDAGGFADRLEDRFLV